MWFGGAVLLTDENGKRLDGAKHEVLAEGVNPKSMPSCVPSWVISEPSQQSA